MHACWPTTRGPRGVLATPPHSLIYQVGPPRKCHRRGPLFRRTKRCKARVDWLSCPTLGRFQLGIDWIATSCCACSRRVAWERCGSPV
jgi:hypothetical protein